MVLRRPSSAPSYDCVIVGAGPAGMAAAVQLKRSGYSILVLERNSPGGLLRNAQQVENYLGFEKISGAKLAAAMLKQMKKWKVAWKRENVIDVSWKRVFEVRTEEKTYFARSVLIATGTQPKLLPMPVPSMVGKKIFYDWMSLEKKLTKGRKVGIIGGGDLAFDFALHVSAFGSEPIIFVRDGISCLPLLLSRAKEKNLSVMESSEIKKIIKQGEKILMVSTKGSYEVDFVLVAIGRLPCGPNVRYKKTQGLCFAGDTVNGLYRQAAIASGDGLKAAMQISEFLSKSHDTRKRIR